MEQWGGTGKGVKAEVPDIRDVGHRNMQSEAGGRGGGGQGGRERYQI